MFPDRGYGFHKTIGLLLLAYCIWVLGSFQIFPVTSLWILVVLLGLTLVSLTVVWRNHQEFWNFFRQKWPLLLCIEIMFFSVFLGWVVFYSYDPFIHHTEQIMDFAFLASSQRALYFPPEDPWLRGAGINYYYFGYVIFGTLGKISGTPTAVGYNLSLASIPALSASSMVSLVVTLLKNGTISTRKALVFGFIGAGILIFLGNLEILFEMLYSFGLGWNGLWDFLRVPGLGGFVVEPGWFPPEDWWWWRATRVINTTIDGNLLDYGIHEFPFFSFLIGDLHPHMIAIPFSLLVIATSFNLLFNQEKTDLGWITRHTGTIAMMGLFLGGLGFINTWNFPTFFFLIAFFAGLKVFRDGGSGSMWSNLLWWAGASLVPAFLAVLFFLPYYSNLSGISMGIHLTDSPGTRFIHGGLLWGAFIIFLFPALGIFLKSLPNKWSRTDLGLSLIISFIPIIPALVLNPFGISESPMVFPLLIILILEVFLCIQFVRKRNEGPALIMVGLMVFATLLIMGPELYRVGDPFQNRMNTIFKFHYQAWIVLALISPVYLFNSSKTLLGFHGIKKIGGAIWIASLFLIIISSAYYNIGSSIDKTNSFQGPQNLDALGKIEIQEPGEFAVIQWLLRNSVPFEGLVEAVGPDYSNFGRISATTGLPTVLGWVGHEQQWRGPDWDPSLRSKDVARIYESTTDRDLLDLLQKYDIQYVILGPRERVSYPSQNLNLRADVLSVIFSEKDYLVYGLREVEAFDGE